MEHGDHLRHGGAARGPLGVEAGAVALPAHEALVHDPAESVERPGARGLPAGDGLQGALVAGHVLVAVVCVAGEHDGALLAGDRPRAVEVQLAVLVRDAADDVVALRPERGLAEVVVSIEVGEADGGHGGLACHAPEDGHEVSPAHVSRGCKRAVGAAGDEAVVGDVGHEFGVPVAGAAVGEVLHGLQRRARARGGHGVGERARVACQGDEVGLVARGCNLLGGERLELFEGGVETGSGWGGERRCGRQGRQRGGNCHGEQAS